MSTKTAKLLIGITGPSTFSNALMQMVEKVLGANYVLLYHNSSENLNEWIDRIDGIIFAGGVDIHPMVYNQPVYSGCGLSNFDIKRDIREIKLLDSCINKKIPIFGICRGHQLLGIYHGLPMLSDISNSNIAHAPSKSGISLNKEEPCHKVTLLNKEEYYAEYKPDGMPDKEILDLIKVGKTSLQPDEIWVNSFHHQALLHRPKIDYPDLKIMGIARIGLEYQKEKWEHAVEFMSGSWGLSVQWHPEHDWDVNPYSASVVKKFNKFLAKK